MEGVTDPYHRETIGKLRNQTWCISTLELDALVEIIDGFPEPHTNDQKRGDTCKSTFQPEDVKIGVSMAYRS